MRNRPDIAFFIDDLRTGGAQKMVVQLANGLSSRGYNVDIVLRKKSGAFIDDVTEDAEIIDLSTSLIESPWYLRKYIVNKNPKYIYTTLKLDNLVAISASMIARNNVKNILCIPNLPSNAEYNSIKSKPIPYLEKILYRYPEYKIAVSRTSKKDAESYFGINVTKHIYVPLDLEEIETKAKKTIEEPWLSTNEDIVTLVAAGRLSKAKDYKTLLKSLSNIRRKHSARLIILGDGPEESALKQTAEDLNIREYVKFPGFVKNPYPYMKSADGFVHSSITDAGSYVLLEAMACGTPVASTASGGPKEVLDNGKYGPLAPPEDAKALADAICTIISEPLPPTVLRERTEDFRLDVILDEYEQFLFHT